MEPGHAGRDSGSRLGTVLARSWPRFVGRVGRGSCPTGSSDSLLRPPPPRDRPHPRILVEREERVPSPADVVAREGDRASPIERVDPVADGSRRGHQQLGDLRRVSGGHGGGRGTPPPTRPPSGRPRGGQRGHKGHARTRPARIDETKEHAAPACPRCGGTVEPSATSTERFEFEAAERALRVLRHVLHHGWCPRCRCRVKPPSPLALPDSDYGPRAHATLAVLRATTGATVGDLDAFTRSVWQRSVSGGQIVAMLDRTAAALVTTFWWIVERVTHEPVFFEDSTSWAFDGERAVLWVFTTRRLTVYWIDPSGSGRVPQAVLGDRIDGGVVTDEAERFQHVAHAGDQRCLAHPLRAARDLLVGHPGDHQIESMMVPLRDHLSWMIGLYPRRADLAASTWLQYRSQARQELIALAERPWTNPDCVRMAKRIRREVDQWVTFLWDRSGEMEPTDNHSERGLRPAVIDRRRVQQNRSLGGVYRDMVLRSVARVTVQLRAVD